MIKAFCNLNNAVEKSIESVPELANIVSHSTKLVKYFKKSGANSSLGLSLKSFCPTRWNTVYYLLKSVDSNWTEIISILKEKGQEYRIEGINKNNLAAIICLLEAFENVSKKLEAVKRPTIHLVLPNIYN